MLGSSFYHGTIRKYVTLFGSMFNDIYIDRVDSSNNALQSMRVPISYGPKDRYLARAQQNPDLKRPVSMVFPRMSFEINNIHYDPDRKLNTIGRNAGPSGLTGNVNTQFNPVAYDFDITLSIIARNADDATRIVEQIIPFFTPEWTTAIKLIPELSLELDIPVVLKSVALEDSYENNFEEKQFTIWTLGFTLKGYLFGPINKKKVIKQIEINFYTPTTNTAAQGVGNTNISEYVIITPGVDANGNPTTLPGNTIPLSQITANSNYGFIVEFLTNYQVENTILYGNNTDFSFKEASQYIDLLLL